ncbi:hypothetical protein B0H14DRAFT_3894057 [Mycena olivaceomarginata]|nr:hypothetical protein B0H14DRAFT_3894057 [Mycena olivaceomarginata]
MTTGVLARATLTNTLYRRALHLTPAARLRLPNSAVVNHVLEVVSAMRVVKYFCYEGSFLNDLFNIRKQELKGIKNIQHSQSSKCVHSSSAHSFTLFDVSFFLLRSALLPDFSSSPGDPHIALAFSLPVLAATLAFVTYTETSKQFDVAVVFASFSLFQLLRQPMMFLPRALSAISDARTAFAGLSLQWFNAPLRDAESFVIDRDAKQEGKAGMEDDGKDKKKKHSKHSEKEKEKALDADSDLEPFALHDISLAVPRGSLAAIVGRVGSGKSRRIAEAGTYPDLIARGGEFARLDREFGGAAAKESSEEGEEEQPQLQVVSVKDAKKRSEGTKGTGKLEGRLMVKETRTTGSVAWSVYGYYMKSGGGWLSVPAIVLAAIVMQGSAVANSYVLVWWQANTFQKPFSFYQILYALLGIAQAAFTWLMGFLMDLFPVEVSKNLQPHLTRRHIPRSDVLLRHHSHGSHHQHFWKGHRHPRQHSANVHANVHLVLAQVIGSVILITILEHYFIVAGVLIVFGFTYFLQFYRSSALEMKRLDSILRLPLRVAHWAADDSKLRRNIPVRPGQQVLHRSREPCALPDGHESAVACGALGCGRFNSCIPGWNIRRREDGIGPGQIGLILTYTTSLTQIFAVSTRSSAEVENYMNSVERGKLEELTGSNTLTGCSGSLCDVVPKEASHASTPEKPTADWPARGAIEFKNVSMAYRPGLPNILHGISLHIKPGEKIGVVGRTGAGKPSLTLCLLRIVEYLGQIVVDDVAIGKIATVLRVRLTDLRSNIAIIPQEPTLFSGTVRAALDPFPKYDYTRLWDALRRSYLVETRPSTPIDPETTAETSSFWVNILSLSFQYVVLVPLVALARAPSPNYAPPGSTGNCQKDYLVKIRHLPLRSTSVSATRYRRLVVRPDV